MEIENTEDIATKPSAAKEHLSKLQDKMKGSINKEGVEKVRNVLKASFLDFLAGEAQEFDAELKPYLPQDLIGGTLPYVPGSEDDVVWHAASQACGTEKIHFCYSVSDERIWYLACPSSSLTSVPNCWCPLAAALPGNSEYWDKETVYLYEQEGLASALRWDPETGRMQVFLGASRTILPRIQSMEMNFVTINADVADVVPWRNRNLRTEKLSRGIIRMLIYSGVLVNCVALMILLISSFSISLIERDLTQVKDKSDEAALQLVETASNVMQSDTIRHMVRIQEILDNISKSNGYLVRYEVAGDRTEWEGIVPEGLATNALDLTTGKFIVNGRLRSYKPDVISPEEGGNVRIRGKR